MANNLKTTKPKKTNPSTSFLPKPYTTKILAMLIKVIKNIKKCILKLSAILSCKKYCPKKSIAENPINNKDNDTIVFVLPILRQS